MMKKILLMVSVVFVGLILASAANAQQVRLEKVYLPCQLIQTSVKNGYVKVNVQATNDTGTWLAQGRVIYSQAQGRYAFDDSPWVTPISTMTLDAMVPVGVSMTLDQITFNYQEIKGPYNCKAWYIK